MFVKEMLLKNIILYVDMDKYLKKKKNNTTGISIIRPEIRPIIRPI